MRRALAHIIFFLLCSFISFSQTSITGKVLNNETGEPLAGASVYFNNTSTGAVTNNAGEFKLPLPTISNAELIVSSIGYEVLVHRIVPEENNNNKKFIFRLTRKEDMMQDVLILPDNVRRKYLQIFIENFLGRTQEAASSSIQNLGSVYFTRSKEDRNGLLAHSDTPLVIVNKMLGYRIHFQLQQFYYDEKNGSNSFYGFTRYEDLGDKKRYIKHRRKAYYGSTMHFYRSLIANKLDENSYKIFQIRTDTLREKNGSTRMMDIGIPVTATDIVKKDSTGDEIQYIATWSNKLMVQYGKEPASKWWLRERTMVNGSLPVGFRSYLLLTEPSIDIAKNGVLVNPMAVLMSGYWIYERAANLLPYDYDPN